MNDTAQDNTKKISIIVPIYNAEKYLDECIQSVTNQNYNNWELFLIDDGSIDSSKLICLKYTKDQRIKYIYKENSGVQDARWTGIKNADSQYVIFLDADDILLPNALITLSKYLYQDIDIIITKHLNFRKSNEIVVSNSQKSIIIQDKIKIMKDVLLGHYWTTVTGTAYKTNILKNQYDVFCNNLSIGEDVMFNLELTYILNPRIEIIENVLYGYRENPESITHRYDDNKMDAVYKTIKYLEAFLHDSDTYSILKKEAGFRLLLLWSNFYFYPNNKYHYDRELRKRMKKLYIHSFKYLYPYLKFYLFKDLFFHKYHKSNYKTNKL